MSNSFDRQTLDLYFEIARAVYRADPFPGNGLGWSEYWKRLYIKFLAIHNEIQDASRSINKSFGTSFSAVTMPTNAMASLLTFRRVFSKEFSMGLLCGTVFRILLMTLRVTNH
jgi:hypothetical protein